MPVVLRAMVDLGSNGMGNGGMGCGTEDGQLSTTISAIQPIDRNVRNRFKPRLQAKGISSLSDIPEINRRNIGMGEVNRQIINMKEEPGIHQTTDAYMRLQVPPISTNLTTGTIRRDSVTSNASSFYCSMKSADISRRSSQTSQHSTILSPPSAANQGVLGMRANANAGHINYNTSSFYDPISPGSSRRSSQLSTMATGGQSLPPPPSSTLLSTHLQRFQNASLMSNTGTNAGRFSIPNTATMSSSNAALSNQFMFGQSDRRMSEPVTCSSEKVALSPSVRPRSVTPKSDKPTTIAGAAALTLASEDHPNHEVVLDEVEEGEMVEKILLIPEEMEYYLNQVDNANQNNTDQSCKASDAQMNNEQSSNGQRDSNMPCTNTHMWRNPPSNMFSMDSPSTQPQSPASGISQMNPLSPPQHNPNSNPIQRLQGDITNQNQTNMYNNQQQRRKLSNGYNRKDQQQPCMEYNSLMSDPKCGHTQEYSTTSRMDTGVTHNASYNNNMNVMNNYVPSTPTMRNHVFQQNNMMHQEPSTMHPMNNQSCRANACVQTPGYFHRTDQSAMNCCQLLSALQISDNVSYNNKIPSTTNTPTSIPAANYQNHSNQAQHLAEIQCGDISQSQMSPAVPISNTQNLQTQIVQQRRLQETPIAQPPSNYQPLTINNMPGCECTVGENQSAQPCMYHSGMRQDTYQRTLEYVQSCQSQSWVESTEAVTSSTHPSSNMIINDMTTSLNSLLEENRFLQMI